MHVRHGAYEHAERDFRAMLAIFERLRSGQDVGSAQAALGDVADMRGDRPAALARYEAAMAEYERLGLRVRLGEVVLRRAAVLRELGRAREADGEQERGRELIGDAPLHRGPGLEWRLSGPQREA